MYYHWAIQKEGDCMMGLIIKINECNVKNFLIGKSILYCKLHNSDIESSLWWYKVLFNNKIKVYTVSTASHLTVKRRAKRSATHRSSSLSGVWPKASGPVQLWTHVNAAPQKTVNNSIWGVLVSFCNSVIDFFNYNFIGDIDVLLY